MLTSFGVFCLFLNLLQVLADGLRTGVTEWPEPLEAKSAVELVQEFLNGVCPSATTPALQVQSMTGSMDRSDETGEWVPFNGISAV